MIQHKIGDLLSGNVDVIAHQVNCRGVMGSGVARQIREQFPSVYASYRNYCDTFREHPERILGFVLLVLDTRRDDRPVWVANLFSQNGYGYDGKRYTDYDAFRECMKQLRELVEHTEKTEKKKLRIGMPFLIGCDRGGGDWATVYKIIEEELRDIDVTLYSLPRGRRAQMYGRKSE